MLMPCPRTLSAIVFTAAVSAVVLGQQPSPQQPPGGRRGGAGLGRGAQQRDRVLPTGTASIGGRVVAADTGKPVKRARVIVAGGGVPRAANTDEQGRYKILSLPSGSYTITATKTGYVDGAYGQRRALRSGTPIEL